MRTFLNWSGWILLRVLGLAVVLIVVVAASIVLLGYTAWGNQFLTDQIASRIATPDLRVSTEGARGLLQGRFRLDRVEISDSKGRYAHAENVALDWSPLELLTGRFHADLASAEAIAVDRAPVTTLPPADDEGTFALPIEVVVDRLALPKLSLGAPLVGRATELAAEGSGRAVEDLLSLKLNANEAGRPDASAKADLAYAVNAQTLALDLTVHEPRDGMLATALAIPGRPAVDLSIKGDGPLAEWAGKVIARLDGTERLSAEARHRLVGDRHNLVVNGTATLGDLAPAELQRALQGQTRLDIDMDFAATGLIDIRKGNLVNDSVSLDVAGRIDPKGAADLSGTLKPANELVSLGLPLQSGELRADIRGASFSISGPYQAAALTIDGDLATLSVPEARLSDLKFSLSSPALDLGRRTGAVNLDLSAASLAIQDPALAKALDGPATAMGQLQLQGDTIAFDGLTVSAGKSDMLLSGSVSLAGHFDTALSASSPATAFLPPALAEKAGPMLRVDGKLSGTAQSLAFDAVKLKTGLATAEASGTLVNGVLAANLAANIPALAALTPDVSGKADLTATVSGPLDALSLNGTIKSPLMETQGQKLTDATIGVAANHSAAGLTAKISAAAMLQDQPLQLDAEINRTDAGALSLPALSAKLSDNALSGELVLGADLLPTGSLSFTFPNLSKLATLAGQQADGDLSGSIDLTSEAGRLAAKMEGTSQTLSASGAALTESQINLISDDLLAGAVSGRIRSSTARYEATALEALDLTFAHRGARTSFAGDARFDNAPVELEAALDQRADGLTLTIDTLSASPHGIPLAVSEQAVVNVANGTVTIEAPSITAGTGALSVRGTVLPVLALDVTARSVPVDLAKPFAADFDPHGTLSANAKITGTLSAPQADFDANIAALTIKPLADAGRGPLDVKLDGRFAGAVLTSNLVVTGIAEFDTVRAESTVKLADNTVEVQRLALTGPRVNGTATGTFYIAGNRLDAGFKIGLSAADLLPASISEHLKNPVDVSGRIAGAPADLTFTDLTLSSNLIAAKANGSLKDGTIAAQLTGTLPDLAALAEQASGKADFTADVSGPIAAPTATLQLKAENAVLAGKPLQSLTLGFTGKLDPAQPSGKLVASGAIDNQPIDVNAEISSVDGKLTVPSLAAMIGPNRIEGQLSLDPAGLPTGKLSFDLPDIAPVAALAGQVATGDLKGTIDLAPVDGRITATVKASGAGLVSAGTILRGPTIDLTVNDLMKAQATGTVRVAELAVAGEKLSGLAADFRSKGTSTDFSASATLDGAPLVVEGNAEATVTGVKLALEQASASPRGLPLKLAAPATISIDNGTINLGTVTFDIGGGTLTASGSIGDALAVKIDAKALPADLAETFSPGLGLTGRIDATAEISGTPAAPAVTFDAKASGISLPQTRGAGLEPADITAKGRYVAPQLEMTFDVAGISRLGPLKAETLVNIAGAEVDVSTLSLSGDRINGTITGDLKTDTSAINANIDVTVDAAQLLPGTGLEKLGGPVAIKAELAGTLPDRVRISNFSATSPALSLTGQASLEAGKIIASAKGQIKELAAFLENAKGAANFDLSAEGNPAAPDVKASLTSTNAALAGRKLDRLQVDLDGKADLANLSARLVAKGVLDGKPIDITANVASTNGQINIPALDLTVGPNRIKGALSLSKTYLPTGDLSFDLPDVGLLAALGGQAAKGDIKGTLTLSDIAGALAAKIEASGSRVEAQGLAISQPSVDLSSDDLLAGKLSGTISASAAQLGDNRLDGLKIDLSRAGPRTDFKVAGSYDKAPLAVDGSLSMENGDPKVTVNSLSASPRGVPIKLGDPVTINLSGGRTELGKIAIKAGTGTVEISGSTGETLDLNIKASALPANLANALSPGLAARGTINATATVKGTAAAPSVTYDLTWQNAATAQTAAAGINSLSVTAKGTLAKSVLSVDASARGNGLTVKANGTVGIAGDNALSLKVSGKLPFETFAAQLAAQGLAVKGAADFDLSVAGTASNPSINGKLNARGASLTAVRQNVTINRIQTSISFNGKTATIASLTGRFAAGGKLSASGTIGIAAASGFPLNLTIKLEDAVYADGRVLATKINGNLTVTGPALSGPTLGGSIGVKRADITVPDRLPASLANVRVEHKNASPEVLAQQKKLRANKPGANGDQSTGGIRLSLTINAPNRIFVRGRGLDAELGGKLLVSGSSADPSVSGSFRLIRGRLSIIGKQLTFSRGLIGFAGGMVPSLDFTASTAVNATTLNVNVAGVATNPTFTFTSSPALPQDEVLAQLIFGRGSASLSPFQIAQLADAVATLSGGQSTSLFNKLRQSLGVDDLNIGTDENGKAQASVGKYLNKRTYIELKQGEDAASSSAAINLDIGKGVKLRGEADASGNTSTGIFYEKEY